MTQSDVLIEPKQFPHDGVDVDSRLTVLKGEVDGLQIAFTSLKKKAWYQDTSTIVAVCALVLSLTTTLVSYLRSRQQDVESERVELRGILERMSAIPRENVEAMKKYEQDVQTSISMGSYFNQENAMLARHASEIAKKLPKDLVSATELYAVGMGLSNANDVAGAKEFFAYAEAAANGLSLNDEVAAKRAIASLDFLTGAPNDGRAKYQEAVDLFKKYRQYDEFTIASTQVNTELGWAGSEANLADFQQAGVHVDSAARWMGKLLPSPGSDGLRRQIDQARATLARASQGGGTVGVQGIPALAPTVIPTAANTPH